MKVAVLTAQRVKVVVENHENRFSDGTISDEDAHGGVL